MAVNESLQSTACHSGTWQMKFSNEMTVDDNGNGVMEFFNMNFVIILLYTVIILN